MLSQYQLDDIEERLRLFDESSRYAELARSLLREVRLQRATADDSELQGEVDFLRQQLAAERKDAGDLVADLQNQLETERGANASHEFVAYVYNPADPTSHTPGVAWRSGLIEQGTRRRVYLGPPEPLSEVQP